MTQRVGIITQARMTSTRLPGKILLKAKHKTILEHHIDRLSRCHVPVIVATTINATDEPVVNICEALGFSYFRGDEHNVLDRFYKCARKYDLNVIIRVTSDCPLINGNLIREGIEQYLKLDNPDVYYSNCLVRTYPRGLDFEIFSFDLLENAYFNATLESDKEHVTPFINQNKSGKVVIVDHTSERDFSYLRWTLDMHEDWKLIQTLIENYNADTLSYSELLNVIENNPELASLNLNVKQKEINL
jgi:spore coat polysaccharide biosynthesis protein SpsF